MISEAGTPAPEQLVPILSDISDKTKHMMDEAHLAMHSLFENMREALEHTKQIEIHESEIDRMEREAIKTVFKMDIDLAHKLQLYGLIEAIVEISDRGEDLSDRIDMMVAQRRI